MNIEKINHWLALIANLGVLAGILFLAVEIQQSNRIAIASTEIGIRNNYSPLNQALYENTDLAELFVKARSADASLTAVDQLRLGAWLTQLANQWISMVIAYENGMVPLETYNVIFDDQRRFIENYPGFRPLLRNILEFYPAHSDSAMQVSIDELLQKYGH